MQVRRQIATLLRNFMKQEKVDEDRIMALSRRYGELDGEISYFYAMAFAEVAMTLTSDQKQTLMKLRNLDPRYTPEGAYLYSAPIDMPEIPDTDFLFVKSAASQIRVTPAEAPTVSSGDGSFSLTSPEVADGGRLPEDYTGDGSSATLPLHWTGAPGGTQSFALIMHHVAPDRTKWYWILYDIPAMTMRLPRNVGGIGTLGNNSVNGRCEYAPPHSKGPGEKTYIYTLYALSSPIELDVEPAGVSRDVLLEAMRDKVLASAQLRVVYSRNASSHESKPQ